MFDTQNMMNGYGLNMNNPAVQGMMANNYYPGSNIPGYFVGTNQQQCYPYLTYPTLNNYDPYSVYNNMDYVPSENLTITPITKEEFEQERSFELQPIGISCADDGVPELEHMDGNVEVLTSQKLEELISMGYKGIDGWREDCANLTPEMISNHIPSNIQQPTIPDNNIDYREKFAGFNMNTCYEPDYQQPINNNTGYYPDPNSYYQPNNNVYYGNQQQYGYDPYQQQNNYYSNPYQQYNNSYNNMNYQQPQQYNNQQYYNPQYNGYGNTNMGYYPQNNNYQGYIPMVYDHDAYNQQLLQQYYANGCQPMQVRYGDTYQEYDPAFEYLYYPSTEEIRAAYDYFMSQDTGGSDMSAIFSNNPNRVSEPKRRFDEWLSQFEIPKPKSPEEMMVDIIEKSKGPHDESDEHFHEVARKMFNEGKISLAEYTSTANGGIEYVTDNGILVNRCYENQIDPQDGSYSPFGWGAYGGMSRQAMEYQKQQQEAYNQHMMATELAFNVAKRFAGVTDEDIKEHQEKQMQEFIEQQEYFKEVRKQLRYEYRVNALAESVKHGISSDQKGYISPAKQKVADHYNKVYKERHKRVKEDMTFKEFMIGGGYADILFDDMRYQNRKQMQKLVALYDDGFCKDLIHERFLFYDPKTGRAPRGLKINRNELEISLPPEIQARHYDERKEKFFGQIRAGHKHPLADVEYLAGKYAPPQAQMAVGASSPGGYLRM